MERQTGRYPDLVVCGSIFQSVIAGLTLPCMSVPRTVKDPHGRLKPCSEKSRPRKIWPTLDAHCARSSSQSPVPGRYGRPGTSYLLPLARTGYPLLVTCIGHLLLVTSRPLVVNHLLPALAIGHIFRSIARLLNPWYRGNPRKTFLQILIRGDFIRERTVTVGHVGGHVEIPGAAQAKEDGFLLAGLLAL